MKTSFYYLPHIALFVLAIAAAASPVRAETHGMNGHKLLEKCRAAINYMDNNETTNDIQAVRDCDDYLTGFRETENVKKIYLSGHYSTGYCFPDSGVSNGKAARIVVSYLENHEYEPDTPARDLIRDAFIDSYPCRD